MVEVKVLHADGTPSVEELCRLADNYDGVVVVGSQYTNGWTTVIEGVRKAGSRWHKIVYVDRDNDTKMSGLSLEDIIEAYKAYFDSLVGFIPVVVSDAGKVVSRRDLLKSGLGVFFKYTALPEVSDVQCSSLEHCRLCISSCPYSAIEGKPPTFSEQRCTECGLCTSACPTGYLFTPSHPPDALRRLFYEARRRGASGVTVTCARARESLYNGGEKKSGLVVELPCIASLRLQEYLFARLLGLEVNIYCPQNIRESCPKGMAGEEYLAIIGDLKHFLRAEVEAQPVYSQNILELLAPLANPADRWLKVERLPLFRVEVNQDKCTLCGACTHECPVEALRLVSGERHRLLFNHSHCIGCSTCVETCPEDAVELSRSVNPFLLSSRGEVEVASSPPAKCRRCGKDIGPEKVIRRLEEKLKRTGAPSSTLEALWLCADCKRKSLEDQFKDILGSSQA